jgi:peroxiredoxin
MCVESDRAHTAFAKSLEIPFPLVSDFNRQVIPAFGVAYTPEQPFTGLWGMSRRSVFVVDRDGTIAWRWITDDPLVPPDIEEVLRAVEALSR